MNVIRVELIILHLRYGRLRPIWAADDILRRRFAAPRFLTLANILRQRFRRSSILSPYRGCNTSLLSLLGFLLDPTRSALTAFGFRYCGLWWLSGGVRYRRTCPSDMFYRRSVVHRSVCRFRDVSKLSLPDVTLSDIVIPSSTCSGRPDMFLPSLPKLATNLPTSAALSVWYFRHTPDLGSNVFKINTAREAWCCWVVSVPLPVFSPLERADFRFLLAESPGRRTVYLLVILVCSYRQIKILLHAQTTNRRWICFQKECRLLQPFLAGRQIWHFD
jgi:hypothetical protein